MFGRLKCPLVRQLRGIFGHDVAVMPRHIQAGADYRCPKTGKPVNGVVSLNLELTFTEKSTHEWNNRVKPKLQDWIKDVNNELRRSG